MPPKRTKADYEADDFVVSDEHDDSAPSKRSKTSKVASKGASKVNNKPQTDDEGGLFWEISNTRRVTISEYRGKTMVSLREYYEKDGKVLPGRKGITLTLEQYSNLVTLLPHIEKVLDDREEQVARPEYDELKAESAEEDKIEVRGIGGSKPEPSRPNFVATDDEDE
ncbi:putative RNA polymerase II transcriptional coactivator [Eremomyces bilateralis CBS 781.70]|uniref:RNA polymerase II transcriptional coactivator n=1 Tax=Eremomyces bilateralis CBS 781.70 TaxID=1392243 RepID=A0A6G1FY71_9PEZI|nr:putative RNA polymerase II transcriptional coactivator [Eremomyces bilateralis CBS 781.70]KAF1810787.1 putative RNA polymerase II transcriptional coactivator [Eremomyces bilateralis CBS 781.70]